MNKKNLFFCILVVQLFFQTACQSSAAEQIVISANTSHQEIVSQDGSLSSALSNEAFYIKIRLKVLEDIEIRDDKGYAFQPYCMSGSQLISKKCENPFQPLPDTQFNANAMEGWVRVGSKETRHIIFPANDVFYIEVARAKGDLDPKFEPENPTFVIRYCLVSIPKGALTQLTVKLNETVNLSFDSDGDGTFESTIKPTACTIK